MSNVCVKYLNLEINYSKSINEIYKIRTASLLTGLSDFDFTRFEDFKNMIIFLLERITNGPCINTDRN